MPKKKPSQSELIRVERIEYIITFEDQACGGLSTAVDEFRQKKMRGHDVRNTRLNLDQ